MRYICKAARRLQPKIKKMMIITKKSMDDSVENWRVHPAEKALDQTVRICLHLWGVFLRYEIVCMKEKLTMTVRPTRNFYNYIMSFVFVTYRFWGQVTHAISDLPGKLYQLLWRQIRLWFDIRVFVVSVI